MKITLIILVSLAVVLGIIAYFAVFSGTQVIEPVASETPFDQTSSTQTLVLGAPTSSPSASSTSIISSTAVVAPSTFSSSFFNPYPVTWAEGEDQLAITAASLVGNQLTLTINVQLGANAECVPINLRMVMDEQGDMAAPNSPATANFPLAPDGTCEGSASTTYPNQNVMFAVDPTTAPFLFTAGPPSNTFFEISTTTNNGLQVQIPQQSG